MIFSNITTPLLGLVDTAVIGHLEHAYYLGGIAVGSMIIAMIFWLAGTLRMATTGVISQALGEQNSEQAWHYLKHSLALAGTLAVLLLLFQWPIQTLAFYLVGGSEQVQFYGQQYFAIRIYSSPAALLNLVFLGYFIASQRVKWVVVQLFVINSINIVLDLWFVIGLDWGVQGAASASVIADYCGLTLLIWVLRKELLQLISQQSTWCKQTFKKLLVLNQNIFIRSLVLQVCLAYMTVRGAQLGDVYLAANAILLNLFIFSAYALDGFAYAAESLVGQAFGENKRANAGAGSSSNNIHHVVIVSGVWSALVGISFALCLYFFGDAWIKVLTDLPEVLNTAWYFMPWMIAICLIAWLSFLLDGVYIGLTQAKAMRDSMLFSGLIFFIVIALTFDSGNNGLWFAFTIFMLMRGLSLTGHYLYHRQRITKL